MATREAGDAHSTAAAVAQLEAVAGAATAEEVQTHLVPLKETLLVDAAAAAAAARILHHLIPSPPVDANMDDTPGSTPASGEEVGSAARQQLKACRMARAMCLAGRVAALGQAGVPQALLSLLTAPDLPAVVRAACAEALVSMALRHACVGDAVAGAPAPPSPNTLPTSPASTTPAAAAAATARSAAPGSVSASASVAAHADASLPAARLVSLLLQLHNDGGDGTSAAGAGAGPGTDPSLGQDPSLEGDIHAGASVAGGAVGPSIMRLIIALSQHRRAMAALMKSDLLPALVTLVEAPGHSKASGSTGSTASGSKAGAAGAAATAAATAAAAATANAPPSSSSTLRRAALHFLLNLTAHVPLHMPLLNAGLLAALTPALNAATPVPVLEPACAIVSNISLGGNAQQQAVVKAGLVPVLARLLTHTNTLVVCHTTDALANTLMHNPDAQAALAAAACPMPGRPTAVGRAAVTAAKNAQEGTNDRSPDAGATSTAAASAAKSVTEGTKEGPGGASSGAKAEGDSRPVVVGGVAGLVRLLHSRDVAVVAKTLRALSNAVIHHPANQQALLATGVTPALVALARYDDAPPVCRQALHLLANLVASNPGAQSAALKAGALQAAAHALTRAAAATTSPPTSPPSKATTSTSVPGASSPATDTSSPPRAGGAPGAGAGISERACQLLANLCAAGTEAKSALKDAGLLPVLVGLVQAVSQGGQPKHAEPSTAATAPATATPVEPPTTHSIKAAKQRTASAAAAAATLANMCLREPAVQTEVVNAGAMAALCAAVASSVAALSSAAAGPNTPAAAAEHQGLHMDLVSKACHAIGSITQGCEEAVSAAIEAGAPALLTSILKTQAVPAAILPEVLRAVGCIAQGSQAAKAALTTAGIVPELAAALRAPSGACVKAALLALVHVADKYVPAQAQFGDVPNAIPSLARMLQVKGEEVLQRACLACVSLTSSAASQGAPGTLPSWLQAALNPAGDPSRGAAGIEEQSLADVTAGHMKEMQGKLAQAGMLPMLVRLLVHPAPEVADHAVMAVCSMVRGNRQNAVQTAAAGGIPALVALIDAPPAPSSPMLARRAVDAWVELGGAPALVKLLTHKRPQVAELAAYRVVGLLGHGATTAPGRGAAPPVMIPSPQMQGVAVPALLKAGIAGALLKGARSRNARVAEAGLLALGALVQVGGDIARLEVIAQGGPAVLAQLTGPPSAMLPGAAQAATAAAAAPAPAAPAPAASSAPPLQPISARGRARGGARGSASGARPASATAVPSASSTRGRVGVVSASAPVGPPSPGVARLAAQVAQLLKQA